MAQRNKTSWNRKDWLWVGGGTAAAVGIGVGAVALSRRDRAQAQKKATTTTITSSTGPTITVSAPTASTGTTSRGSTVSTTSAAASGSPAGSSTTQTTTTCQSPYGCDQAAGPTKACASGFASVYTAGYGWGCQETAAGYQAAFHQFLTQLGPDGVTVSGAPMLPGGSLATEAQAIATYLQSKYGTTYDVLPQKNGSVLVTTPARAAATLQLPNPAFSASTLSGVNANTYGQATALAAQYASQYHVPYRVYYSAQTGFAVIPDGETPPSGTTVLYSTTSGATAEGQAIAQANSSDYQSGQGTVTTTQEESQAVSGFVAINNAFPAATANLPADYTGFVHVSLGNGSFSDIYVQDGAYSSVDAQGQSITLHIAGTHTSTSSTTTAAATTTTSASSTNSNGSASATTTASTSAPGPSTQTTEPTLVSTSLEYLYNENSCLYTYRKIGHYSNGATQDLGTVTLQQGSCADKPTVSYTYRKYLYNVNSCYYTYAIMAVYTNGTQERVGTVTVKQGTC